MEFKKANDNPVESTYEKSKRLRRNDARSKKLGFRRPVGRKREKGRSIISIRICDLTDDEFELLQKKNELIPEHKRVLIEHDWKKSMKEVIGEKLAEAIVAMTPDMEEIRMLADPFPDLDKRLGGKKCDKKKEESENNTQGDN